VRHAERKDSSEVSLVAAEPKRYERAIAQEVSKTPPEYLPALLRLVRVFRETMELKPAGDSFEEGWREADSGDTLPVSQLWEGIDCR